MAARARRFFLPGLAIVAALWAAPGCRREAVARPGATIGAEYFCPMHPTFVSDQPGSCSICGMQLTVRATRSRRRAARATAPPPAAPGSAPAAGDVLDGDQSDAEVVDSGRTVAGRATVFLTEDSRRMLGIRTEPVRRMRLWRQIRAVGRVAGQRGGHVSVLTDVYENDVPWMQAGKPR